MTSRAAGPEVGANPPPPPPRRRLDAPSSCGAWAAAVAGDVTAPPRRHGGVLRNVAGDPRGEGTGRSWAGPAGEGGTVRATWRAGPPLTSLFRGARGAAHGARQHGGACTARMDATPPASERPGSPLSPPLAGARRRVNCHSTRSYLPRSRTPAARAFSELLQPGRCRARAVCEYYEYRQPKLHV